MIKIGIINLGINNIKSIAGACNTIGDAYLINCHSDVEKYTDVIVLPGNGNFSEGMRLLEDLKIKDLLLEHAHKKNKLIGICLGLQLFMEKSDEAKGTKGLSFIKGDVKKIDSKNFKVPLLGWYDVDFSNELINTKSFFFNNGYMVEPKEQKLIKGSVNNIIPAYVVNDNIYGFQFHPEKSSFHGLKLLGDSIKE
jgi:glutamine amidotransferase